MFGQTITLLTSVHCDQQQLQRNLPQRTILSQQRLK